MARFYQQPYALLLPDLTSVPLSALDGKVLGPDEINNPKSYWIELYDNCAADGRKTDKQHGRLQFAKATIIVLIRLRPA